MSKFGMEKKTVHEVAAAEQVAHKHVPGVAYNIANPAQKLMFTIGGGFFNEPKYYDSNRSYSAFMTELLTTGKISSTIKDDQGLTEQAREIIETAHAVANSDSPEDLFVIAAWARDKTNGLRLRTTPQILLAVAAAVVKTQKYLPIYGPTIMSRADEIRQVFAAFRHLFQSKDGSHKGSLPHALRKALAHALAKQSPYNLLKYDGSDRPNFIDVAKMLRGKDIRKYLNKVMGETRTHWPLSKGMFDYLATGKIGEDAPQILIDRQKFLTTSKQLLADGKGDELTALVECAGLTWENIISHLGSTKTTWELCIPIMQEMALTRNLRNFEQAGISKESWDKVYEKLLAQSESVQLPFRWFTALKEVTSTESKSIVGLMLDKACDRAADLPGITVAFTDNSGSAVGNPVSGKSNMRVSDCGNTLEAVLAKKLGRRAKIAAFGDRVEWINFSQADSCLSIKEQIDTQAKKVGMSTETGLWDGLTDLIEKKEKVDRIIIMSDFCCYTRGDAGLAAHGRNKYAGKSIQSLCEQYRRTVNPDVYVYSINLNGHGQAQTKPDAKRTVLLSGWSEKIFDIIRDSEGTTQNQNGQVQEVPTIDVLRNRYKMQ